MKERGVLPKHLRFQVSIPMINSVLPPRIFPNQNDLAKIRPVYTAAMRAEIAMIIAKIPNDELALQWDCSTELQDAYGSIPGVIPSMARSSGISMKCGHSRRRSLARPRSGISFASARSANGLVLRPMILDKQ